MCQCVYVCVCVRVFFSTACVSCFWLGAEPCLMIGSPPLWCHGVLSAGMKSPLCSPAGECSCLRALASFSVCGWSYFLVIRSFETRPPWCQASFGPWIGSWSSFNPLCFQGKCVFQTWGMFSSERGWLLYCGSTTQRSAFSLPFDLFNLLPLFLPVAHITLTHDLYQ